MITDTDIREAAQVASAAKAQYGDPSAELTAALARYNALRRLRDEQRRFSVARRTMDDITARLHEQTLALAEAKLRYGENSFQARAEETKYRQAQSEYDREVAKEREEGMRSASIQGFFQDLANKLRVAGGGAALLSLGVLWMLASRSVRR